MKTLIRALIMSLVIVSGLAVAAGAREDIHYSAEEAQPLLPGMTVPEFNVLDVYGKPVAFKPEAMEKPLILTFFRGGWCPYCNLHLSEMRHAEKELLEMGFDIWFISMDQPDVLVASLDEPELPYTLLSDSKLEATRAFGIAFRIPDSLHERYLGMDIDVEAASGESHHVLPVPSTYIIGKEGVISFQYTNTDYHVRLAPEVLLAAAQAHAKDYDKRLRRRRAEQRAAE